MTKQSYQKQRREQPRKLFPLNVPHCQLEFPIRYNNFVLVYDE